MPPSLSAPGVRTAALRAAPPATPVLVGALLVLAGFPGPAEATPRAQVEPEGGLGARLAAEPRPGLEAPPGAADTLRLPQLQEAAVALDPRLDRRALETRTTELRLGNLDRARRPDLRFTGDAGIQSEVADIPIGQPGLEVPSPPRDRYEASVESSWLLWDGGRLSARARVEEARREAALAGIDVELHDVRTRVSEAFFGALLVQEQLREARTLLEDLEARLAEVRARVEAGAGLPGDTAVIRAELLGARQQVDALEAEQRATLDILGHLTGRAVEPSHVLALPELTGAVEASPAPFRSGAPVSDTPVPEAARLHPRYHLFDRERTRLQREAAAVRAERRPRLSAFGELAYGSPGYAQFDDTLHEYARAGLVFEWRPWDWGTRERELEVLEIRRRLVETRERVFTDRLLRAVQRPLRTMARARAALESDDAIIALRQQVERQARAQLAERAITPARYTDARTDLLEARVARLRHRVELARAQAEYLLILGAELEP